MNYIRVGFSGPRIKSIPAINTKVSDMILSPNLDPADRLAKVEDLLSRAETVKDRSLGNIAALRFQLYHDAVELKSFYRFHYDGGKNKDSG